MIQLNNCIQKVFEEDVVVPLVKRAVPNAEKIGAEFWQVNGVEFVRATFVVDGVEYSAYTGADVECISEKQSVEVLTQMFEKLEILVAEVVERGVEND